MIWTAVALPVIRMMMGLWWEAGLAVALLFSVLMSTLLSARVNESRRDRA